MSIPVHFFSDIDGVVDGALAVDDGVPHKDAIALYNRVNCLV